MAELRANLIMEAKHTFDARRYIHPGEKTERMSVELEVKASGPVARMADVVKTLRDDADAIEALAKLGAAGEVARTLPVAAPADGGK